MKQTSVVIIIVIFVITRIVSDVVTLNPACASGVTTFASRMFVRTVVVVTRTVVTWTVVTVMVMMRTNLNWDRFLTVIQIGIVGLLVSTFLTR